MFLVCFSHIELLKFVCRNVCIEIVIFDTDELKKYLESWRWGWGKKIQKLTSSGTFIWHSRVFT